MCNSTQSKSELIEYLLKSVDVRVSCASIAGCVTLDLYMHPSEQKLKSAFQTVLGLNGSTDFSKVAYGQTQGWDSVAHMALVAEIETQFDIMLETEDVIDLSSFEKGKDILATKYGVEFA